jgi:hypothetical protein
MVANWTGLARLFRGGDEDKKLPDAECRQDVVISLMDVEGV